MRDVHEELFQKAIDVYEREGFEKASDFLVEQTKKPYEEKG